MGPVSTAMQDITVAGVNFQTTFGRVDRNLDRIADWAMRLAQQGVNLACFPELCVCGYSHTPAIRGLAQPVPGPATERLVEIAAQAGIILSVGLAELDPHGQRFITQLVVTPDGIAGHYRKTHLGPLEQGVYVPGHAIDVSELGHCTVGMQLCYDSHFPEISTLQALAGAELLLVSFATPRDAPVSLKARLLRYLTARAYDNGCYVVSCNLAGDDGAGQAFPGVALVIGPKGELLAESVGWQEGAVIATLDGCAIERIRQTKMGHFLGHRRPDLYGALADA